MFYFRDALKVRLPRHCEYISGGRIFLKKPFVLVHLCNFYVTLKWFYRFNRVIILVSVFNEFKVCYKYILKL